ncbi:hypothetical protein AB1Y20_015774 [Prymnesium parvum]|uniref:J domain-containing protein n=1 Tax=Prymnesium parvum TaxID=97485 RepID=A0AB34JYQ5_PRYPA
MGFQSTEEAVEHILRFQWNEYSMLKLLPGCGSAAAESSFRKVSKFLHPDRTKASGAVEAFELALQARDGVKANETLLEQRKNIGGPSGEFKRWQPPVTAPVDKPRNSSAAPKKTSAAAKKKEGGAAAKKEGGAAAKKEGGAGAKKKGAAHDEKGSPTSRGGPSRPSGRTPSAANGPATKGDAPRTHEAAGDGRPRQGAPEPRPSAGEGAEKPADTPESTNKRCAEEQPQGEAPPKRSNAQGDGRSDGAGGGRPRAGASRVEVSLRAWAAEVVPKRTHGLAPLTVYLKDTLPQPIKGEALVGARVRVWWDGNRKWFKGRVEEFSAKGGVRQYKVHYDDGEQRWHALEEHLGDTTNLDAWDFEAEWVAPLLPADAAASQAAKAPAASQAAKAPAASQAAKAPAASQAAKAPAASQAAKAPAASQAAKAPAASQAAKAPAASQAAKAPAASQAAKARAASQAAKAPAAPPAAPKRARAAPKARPRPRPAPRPQSAAPRSPELPPSVLRERTHGLAPPKVYLKDMLAQPIKGEALVGARVQVWWHGNEAWFEGRVEEYRAEEGTREYRVLYEKGEERWHELEEELGDATNQEAWDFEPEWLSAHLAATISAAAAPSAAPSAAARAAKRAASPPAARKRARAASEGAAPRQPLPRGGAPAARRAEKKGARVSDWRWRNGEEQWAVGEEGAAEWRSLAQLEAAYGEGAAARMLRVWEEEEREAAGHSKAKPCYIFRRGGEALRAALFLLRLQMSIPWTMCKRSFDVKARRWVERLLWLGESSAPSQRGQRDLQALAALLQELAHHVLDECFREDFDAKRWHAELEVSLDHVLAKDLEASMRTGGRHFRSQSQPPASGAPQEPSGDEQEEAALRRLVQLAEEFASGIKWEGED